MAGSGPNVLYGDVIHAVSSLCSVFVSDKLIRIHAVVKSFSKQYQYFKLLDKVIPILPKIPVRLKGL